MTFIIFCFSFVGFSSKTKHLIPSHRLVSSKKPMQQWEGGGGLYEAKQKEIKFNSPSCLIVLNWIGPKFHCNETYSSKCWYKVVFSEQNKFSWKSSGDRSVRIKWIFAFSFVPFCWCRNVTWFLPNKFIRTFLSTKKIVPYLQDSNSGTQTNNQIILKVFWILK